MFHRNSERSGEISALTMNGIHRLLAAVLFVAVSPCSPALQVTDDAGRTVGLEQPARRILTLSPHATELILALGLESRLVAVADFFDYPEVLSATPRLSSLGRVDRERLLLFRPDLVIAWGSGNNPGDIHWLERSGIPVFISEPASLEAIASSLEKLGLLAGVPEQGLHAGTEFRRRLAGACPRKKDVPRQAAYYEIWPAPPMTIGARHWLNQVLDRAALRNIFDDIPRQLITVSRESLLARPHQITIVAHSMTPAATGQPPRITADATLGRPGPRILEGLEKLCGSL